MIQKQQQSGKTSSGNLYSRRLLSLFLSVLFFCFSSVGIFRGYSASFAESPDGIYVYPGGFPFGVTMSIKGALVADCCDIRDRSPASEAGILPGDIIVRAGNEDISGSDDLRAAVSRSGGSDILLTVQRDGKNIAFIVKPAYSEAEGEYRLGLVLRDDISGLGTVTFLLADKTHFAGLGHGIYAVKNSNPIPLSSGGVFDVGLLGIKKSIPGVPGELHGKLIGKQTGYLSGNTECGVFGVYFSEKDLPDQPVRAAETDEIVNGEAYILSTLENGKREKYSCRISCLDMSAKDGRNFSLEITDKSLREKSGGIIQGMSGSPIIQNGKLIGAVTHVFVEDPKNGYGITIRNMLDRMPG